MTPLPATAQLTDQRTLASAASAVRALAESGYEQITARDLADAIGMSRSTFFRRFGSKEDIVFTDHDFALAKLAEYLEESSEPPLQTVVLGTTGVMHRLIRDEEAARLRSKLLRDTPSLRDRELVITHRYERVLAEYLERNSMSGTPSWVPTALAAGLVAVHNAALRRWLRGEDALVIRSVERDLTELSSRFSPWFGSDDPAARVVVTAFDAKASPDEVIRAVQAQFAKE